MKKINIINILFVCAVMAILVAGLFRTVISPKEINTYENRYASQLPSVSAENYLDGTFQDGVDAALMDQIPFAQHMKSFYNQSTTQFLKRTLDGVADQAGLSREQYFEMNGLCLYGDDYIVYWPRIFSNAQEALDRKIQVLNKTFSRHPELDFYLYYIEKDTDLDFETGKKSGLADYLKNGLQLPAEKMGVFTIDDFEIFSNEFYKTDAHWKYQGSDRGYHELTELLGCAGEPLLPTGAPVKVSDSFSGKKAASVAGEGVFTEEFYAYPYDFPDMTVTINGQSAEDYGQQEAFLSGQAAEPISYGGFYGGDNGETILSTGTQGRGKLLVIGESFDNAVLKLLASHYDALHSIDLRYYEHSMGHPFDLSSYTEENGISSVLLIGNIDYFIQDTFDPEG